MGFEPGHPKFGGRQKGRRNKRSIVLDQALKGENCPVVALIRIYETAMVDFNRGSPSTRADLLKVACQAAGRLLPYCYPKTQVQ